MALPLARYSGVTVNVGANAYLLVAPSAVVTVYIAGTLVPASLFSDSGGAHPLANPFTSDSVTGAFTFCAGNGLYDITVTGVGVPPYTIPAVQLVYLAPPVGQILVSTTTFPHAQILTLPTTAWTILSAPGAGLTIVPLFIRVVADTRFGAYTNIDPGTTPNTGGQVSVHTADWTRDTFTALTNGYAGGTGNTTETLISQWLGIVGQQLWTPIPYGQGVDPTTGALGAFFAQGWGLLGDPTIIPAASAQNQALVLALTNGALGNLTGGGLGNSLTATVAYLIL